VRFGVWRDGNEVKLLENGDEFFPRVFEAIGRAEREVLVETFIVDDDDVGRELQRTLIAAAQRKVDTTLTVDGYGSAPLPASFIEAMTDAGVHVHVFDPKPKVFGWRTNIWRRLHRKLVVIDGRRAFVGGINYSATQLNRSHEEGRLDYAVEVTGPVVYDIQRVALHALGRKAPPRLRGQPRLAETGTSRALFVTRDNERHQNDIELHYRIAIRNAQHEVLIANAYFFPGYLLLRELYAAARRGVDVQLIMQGNPDMPLVRWATTTLYDDLRRAGITIHEYRECPLHAKVAVVDGTWATVGSSNLDPLSLFLNLEANLVVLDRAFATQLRGTLNQLVDNDCDTIECDDGRPRLWRQWLGTLAFHALRRFPQWADWAPGRRQSTSVPAREALQRSNFPV
jgi:cardiolipin synthase A/B